MVIKKGLLWWSWFEVSIIGLDLTFPLVPLSENKFVGFFFTINQIYLNSFFSIKKKKIVIRLPTFTFFFFNRPLDYLLLQLTFSSWFWMTFQMNSVCFVKVKAENAYKKNNKTISFDNNFVFSLKLFFRIKILFFF